MRRVRGGRIAMIFQNPLSSLNPVFTIGEQVCRIIRIHQEADAEAARRQAVEMFSLVRLPNPRRLLRKHLHEIRGSQLQRAKQLTYLFITHDLQMVKHIADRILVMYLGRLVEAGPVEAVFRRPLHPYTQALLSAMPGLDPAERAERILLEGDVPSPIDPPVGCRFHTRCRQAQPVCRQSAPVWRKVGADRRMACHRV